MNREIYLDNAATTLPWPEVRVAVARVLSDDFGNASSVHRRGLHAAREIEQAAKRIAQLVGSGNWKVVFTSGGTESDNLAIAGSVPRGPRTAIVTSSVEHAAVSACCAASCSPADLTVISAGSTGVVDPETFADRKSVV